MKRTAETVFFILYYEKMPFRQFVHFFFVMKNAETAFFHIIDRGCYLFNELPSTFSFYILYYRCYILNRKCHHLITTTIFLFRNNNTSTPAPACLYLRGDGSGRRTAMGERYEK
jgi:hypothetical protein